MAEAVTHMARTAARMTRLDALGRESRAWADMHRRINAKLTDLEHSDDPLTYVDADLETWVRSELEEC